MREVDCFFAGRLSRPGRWHQFPCLKLLVHALFPYPVICFSLTLTTLALTTSPGEMSAKAVEPCKTRGKGGPTQQLPSNTLRITNLHKTYTVDVVQSHLLCRTCFNQYQASDVVHCVYMHIHVCACTRDLDVVLIT